MSPVLFEHGDTCSPAARVGIAHGFLPTAFSKAER